MQGVVTAIGNATFFGRTAKLVASAGAKSHSQKAVVQIGDFLILLAAALAVVLVGVQVYRQMVVPGHWSWDAAGQITQFILVLLVASVPVALPAVMSVTLALGALALSKQKAIVSRLSAIDELAGVDVLCSDKTGTLTQNKLTLFFNIQPLTAIMIVALALLDDIPIMTIAYDNVRTAPAPVRWDMHRTLIFAWLMGLMATAQSFGIVFLGMEWMNDPAMIAKIPLDHSHLQTMLFLQLAAGGHMLLFVVRSRGLIFSPPLPSAPLFLAIVATQIVAVLMCAFGVLVPALPWRLIGIVWAYVIVWTVL